MKTFLIILSVAFSLSATAQPAPTVSGRTAIAKDTIITLPTNSITLTGTAVESDPGHPIIGQKPVERQQPLPTVPIA